MKYAYILLIILLSGCHLFDTSPKHHLIYHCLQSSADSQLNAEKLLYSENDPVTIARSTGSKEGHIFTGWNTQLDNSGTSYEPGEVISMPPHDLILYSQWNPKDLSISFNSNGGSPLPPKTVTYGSPYGELPVPTKPQKVFAGWHTPNNTFITDQCPALHTTLTAQWRDPIISFTTEGETEGSLPPKASHPAGTEITIPGQGDLVRRGFTFMGWGSSESLSHERFNKNNIVTVPDDDVTFRALWLRNIYQVSFDVLREEIENPPAKSVFYEAFYGELPKLEKNHYYIDSWQYDGSAVTSVTRMLIDSNHTLLAAWKPIQYQIDYILNGGINHPMNPDSYTLYCSVSLQDPSRKGYLFMGWLPPGIPEGLGNITFEAQWEPEAITVTFDSQGGTPHAPVLRDFDTPYGDLPAPVKHGHLFGGWWNDEGYQVHSGTLMNIPQDHTLTARWVPEQEALRMRYSGNDNTEGEAPEDTYFSEGDTATVLDDGGSLRQGILRLRDWNTAPDGSGITYKPGDAILIKNNLTLYAQYTHVFEIVTDDCRHTQEFEIIIED